jgi:hypothetical protein
LNTGVDLNRHFELLSDTPLESKQDEVGSELARRCRSRLIADSAKGKAPSDILLASP